MWDGPVSETRKPTECPFDMPKKKKFTLKDRIKMLHNDKIVHLIMSTHYVHNTGIDIGDTEDNEEDKKNGDDDVYDSATTEKNEDMIQRDALHYYYTASKPLKCFKLNGQKS